MAAEVNLAENEEYTLNSGNSDTDGIVNITALGSYGLTVDGVEATIGQVVGVDALDSKTYTATNGGQINLESGLLDANILSNLTLNVDGASGIDLDASTISALSGLNNTSINFTGEDAGSFVYTPPTLGVASTTTFNVTGVTNGDSIQVVGESLQLGGYDSTDGVLSLNDGGNPLVGGRTEFEIDMTQDEYDAWVNGRTEAEINEDLADGITALCFAEGSMIATPSGEVAIETLSIGDDILTASGETTAVKWIGYQTIRPIIAKDDFQAVRFSKDSIAPGQPNQDLTVTASHGMIIDGLVINASALVNGTTVKVVPTSELPQEVTYYHIETENHEVILANGAEAETYIDYVDRKAFENYDEYLSLYGMDTTITEMKHPRISARRLLPLAIRERFGIQEPQLSIQAA